MATKRIRPTPTRVTRPDGTTVLVKPVAGGSEAIARYGGGGGSRSQSK